MYLLDENGEVVDSEFSLDIDGGKTCVVVESSGGANPAAGVMRRNPDYNSFLYLLLTRLRNAGASVTRIVLDSKPVANLPVEDRIAHLSRGYPVDLNSVDIDEFRRAFGRSIAKLHRSPSAKSGGNAQKRIRICLDRNVTPKQIKMPQSRVFESEKADDYSPGFSETEKEYLRKARVGQGKFRTRLLESYGSTCPATGIQHPDLLVASHIKPWRACTNIERLDENNGILLSSLIDRLFDKGLATFDRVGRLTPSPTLSNDEQKRCRITEAQEINLTKDAQKYMEYHRAVEFRR